jgi:hypothetical protein
MSDVGRAVGRIEIDTSQAQRAPAVMAGVAQGINRSMSQVNAGANKATQGINSIGGAFRTLGAAATAGFGVAAIAQVARLVVELEGVATAYDRQAIAARALAGSQEEVNDLLAAYEQATGGAIDKATALADVTRLQAIGFADSAEEIERFARSVRGISLATGQNQDYVSQQLQLAIANQSTMRLDQLGLGVSEVKKKVAELRAENRGLTEEMAYQEAVLGLAEQKFGALTKSQEAQATGVEKASKAWKDFRLQLGQTTQSPVNAFFDRIAHSLAIDIQAMKDFAIAIENVKDKLRELGVLGMGGGAVNQFGDPVISPPNRRGAAPDPRDSADAQAAESSFAEGYDALRTRTDEQIMEAGRSHQQQRLSSEREYQQTVTREARDFAVSRTRAEIDHLNSIAELQQDANLREVRMELDLQRSLARAQSDSVERIAEMREDTNERLTDIEENFQRERERRAEDHRDRLMEAAGRLDAKAVAEAQRAFKKSEDQAQESYDEQRAELKESLDERIADEQEALDERIADAKEAHALQLQAGRDADAKRFADMNADFALRKQREDEDRALRLADMATDHAAQLAERDRAHLDRIAQIREHANDEHIALEDAHAEAMVDAGVRDKELIDRVEKREKKLEDIYDAFWNHALGKAIEGLPKGHPARIDAEKEIEGFAKGGYIPRDMLAMLHAGEYVMPAAQVAAGGMMGGATFTGDVHVSVSGSTNMGASEMYTVARQAFVDALQEIAA